MNTLWTPWRMEHIVSPDQEPGTCLFEPPTSQAHAKEFLLLHQGGGVVILLNRFPYTNGHLLVAPARHVPCITDLNEEESEKLMSWLRKATAILKQVLVPDGFNIGLNLGSDAGAGIDDHIHFHIVPRWQGDHNFMTVVSEIRTIPQHIEHTFDTLLPLFTKES
ncbi:MAG: HIT domain-containing protein [Desulfobulbaceae bacterium]|nr:MAG: HIT domain-containing protein [Desulfobulbaceae bacterium]